MEYLVHDLYQIMRLNLLVNLWLFNLSFAFRNIIEVLEPFTFHKMNHWVASQVYDQHLSFPEY